MQTYRGLLEPNYSGRKMHQPTPFHHRQRRVEPPDRRSDSLSPHPHGLGFAYH